MSNIAFIIPRYHIPQAGGAEVLVQNLAEKLVKIGHKIDVLTTCSQDHTRWGNDLKSGRENIHGVNVHRFTVDERANFSRFVLLEQRIDRGWPLNLQEENHWIKGSVHSKELYAFLDMHQSQWDALIFAPYLFGLTYQGIQIVSHKSFLIPCLHNEPYAYLHIFQSMFQNAKGILFNSLPEKELARNIFSIPEEKCSIVGMGFEPFPLLKEKKFRKKFNLGSDPFLLYAGRREKGKNTPLLINYFQTYKKHHPGSLKLVLIGSGEIEEKLSTDIIDCGFVSVEEKQEAYEEALLTCQPSLNESFSIVLMESWLAQTPVLVNAKSDVTRFHTESSQGGLWFKNFFEFESCLDFSLNQEEIRRKMGHQGKTYVLNNFQWDHVLDRFIKAIEPGKLS